jgi:hypothetical protein
MVKEFCQSGKPHLHIVVDAPLSAATAAKVWSQIVGCSDQHFTKHCASVKWVHDQNRLANYMGKATQKTAPHGFEIGRWWSAFGVAKPRARVVLRGKRGDLTQFLQEIWDLRPGGRAPRTQDGSLPFRFWLRGGVDLLYEVWVGLGVIQRGS